MAQLFTVVQRKGFSKKVYNKGIYTNKKKMWEVWFATEILSNTKYKNVKFYDDVKNLYRDPTYSNLCNMLTANGRVCVFATDETNSESVVEPVIIPKTEALPIDDLETDRMILDLNLTDEPVATAPITDEPKVNEIQIALITSAEKNVLRNWDIDDEGNLVPNPVGKDDDVIDSETNV